MIKLGELDGVKMHRRMRDSCSQLQGVCLCLRAMVELSVCSVCLFGYFKYSRVIALSPLWESIVYLCRCRCYQTTASTNCSNGVKEREREEEKEQGKGSSKKKKGSAKLNGWVFCLLVSQWEAYNVC